MDRAQRRKKAMAGTNLPQDEYLQLENAVIVEALTDAEAVLLVNNNFGFEAARIEILHEAEIDATQSGARCLKIEKAARKPLRAASDWNYVRFNVHTRPGTWYYEMINGTLYQVSV
jgi:hypothetical protein